MGHFSLIVAPSSSSSLLKLVFTTDLASFNFEGKASSELLVTTFKLANLDLGYVARHIVHLISDVELCESSKSPQYVQNINDPTTDILT